MKLPDLHDRNTQIAAGGLAAVAAFALYRRKTAAASSSTSAGTVAAGGTLSDPIASGAFGAASIETNIVQDLQPQLDALAAQIGGLKASSSAPKPPPSPTIPPRPSAPAHKTVAVSLPNLNAKNFMQKIALSSGDLLAIGTVDKNGKYSGYDVGHGAPVYFEAPGSNVAVQGTAPKGSKAFTLKSLSGYVGKTKR